MHIAQGVKPEEHDNYINGSIMIKPGTSPKSRLGSRLEGTAPDPQALNRALKDNRDLVNDGIEGVV